MSSDALFGRSILMSFAAFGLVAKLFIWPKLGAIRARIALGLLGAAFYTRQSLSRCYWYYMD